ncbi:efflux RND transporter permease subunit [Euryhalocaulis caribicus]|uniref:efflux RND transporter permease subunit n=1 Tax=Euryhalocaulis caribicus TaxID=1161401 RepID=UPI0003A85E87|nr:efflux RND transporter permease subunit [Euryhalocaulis caribicus]
MSPATVSHKGIFAWWARNPVAANLLMFVLLIGGAISFMQMEREVFPSVPWNGVSVSVAWPGASPQDVEEQILVRIEEAMADLDGIEEITSTAREGSGSVNIEAERSVDMTAFIDEVKLRVDSVNNLPPSIYPPVVSRWKAQNQFIGLVLHGDVERRVLQEVARDVRDEVAQLPGASLAQVNATIPEEVSIELSEEALRRYNLTFDEVARAIRAQSLNSSGGQVRTDLGDVPLTARNLADTKQDFETIIIRQTPGGATIRLGDVANVVDGFADGDINAEFDGDPMALIMLMTPEKMNVVETATAVEEFVERKADDLPAGLELELWWDDSEAYEARMATISGNAFLGLGLVFIVLMLSLRPAVAFWATAGIAVAFAGGIIFLPAMGVSLNMLSLFAFLLVTGVVVDDAIVIGENIHNEVESGRHQGLDAAVLGTQLVAKPVIFAVITTMMAFAPWMMLSGPEVQMTRQISLVVIFALAFSLVESLLILPAHLSHLKPTKPTSKLMQLQDRIANGLVWFARNIYRPVVELALKLRYITIAVFMALFMLAIGLQTTGWLGFKFMPDIESEFIQVTIELPEGTPFSRSEVLKTRLEAAQDQVDQYYKSEYGEDSEMFVGSAVLALNGRVRAWMEIAAPEERPGRNLPTSDVSERLREAMGPVPDAEEIRFDATFSGNQPEIMYSVNSDNLDRLQAAVADLKAQLGTYDAVFDITDNLQASQQELQISLKPGAQALGLTLSDVTRQVRQAYYGEEVQRLPREGQDVRVMVRYPEETRRDLDSLRNLRVRTANGAEVPLYTVAETNFAPSIQRITRRDRMRSVTVSAEVAGGSENPVRGDIFKDLEENFFPQWTARYPNVTRGQLGDAEGQAEFMQEILVLQLVMLIGMYVLLAVAFRSYFQPLLIMTAIPFATAGAYFGHVLFGMPLALFSFFGIGAAAGVVVNDNLVLVDMVNRLRQSGLGAYQALVEAGTQRFRPILLTTVTTFVGIMPITAEQSTQAAFLKPMVVSLAFGVVFALFLTLFMVPALYATGVDIARFSRRMWTGQRQPKFGSSWEEEKEFAAVPEKDVLEGGHTAPAE